MQGRCRHADLRTASDTPDHIQRPLHCMLHPACYACTPASYAPASPLVSVCVPAFLRFSVAVAVLCVPLCHTPLQLGRQCSQETPGEGGSHSMRRVGTQMRHEGRGR